MKKEKRHISIKMKLIAGIVIAILVLATLLYFYHNHWKGVYVVNDVPTSFVGIAIIFVISLTIITFFLLIAILLGVCFPNEPKK